MDSTSDSTSATSTSKQKRVHKKQTLSEKWLADSTKMKYVSGKKEIRTSLVKHAKP